MDLSMAYTFSGTTYSGTFYSGTFYSGTFYFGTTYSEKQLFFFSIMCFNLNSLESLKNTYPNVKCGSSGRYISNLVSSVGLQDILGFLGGAYGYGAYVECVNSPLQRLSAHFSNVHQTVAPFLKCKNICTSYLRPRLAAGVSQKKRKCMSTCRNFGFLEPSENPVFLAWSIKSQLNETDNSLSASNYSMKAETAKIDVYPCVFKITSFM